MRRLNEDSLLAYPPVFLVADGMGGHAAGDVASRIAVEEFSQLAGRPSVTADDVHTCVHRVAARLRETIHHDRTAGTTVAGVAIATHEGGSYWLVFNIGDSRVYCWASGELRQISVDHSVVQELIDHGEIAPHEATGHPERHVITRAIGNRAEPDPDYWLIPAAAGDRVLVCTDGLTVDVDDTGIADVLATVADPQEAAQHLVAAALAAGGQDNISVVVVDVAMVGPGTDLENTAEGSSRDVLLAEDRAAHSETWDEVADGATIPRPTRTRVPEVDR